MPSEIDLLKQRISELEAENAKLKQIIEENAKRDAEIVELRSKIAKLECDVKENKMQKQTITTQNTPSKEEMSSPLSENNFENSKQKFCINNSEQIDSRCDDTPTSEISDNSSNSDIYKESLTRCSTSPICAKSKSLEDKEMGDFLDRVYKETVSNEIREKNREKKLLRNIDASVSQDREVLSDAKTFSRSETPQEEKRLPLNHNENPNTPEMKIPYSEPKSTNLLPNQKIPYNQKVERGLRHELFVCITDNNSKGNKIVDIQIPEFSLETILTGSSKVTSQNIVDLFRVAMKVRQKESLCWYCYYKAYENRVSDVKSVNNIDVQSARTLVYNEIKSLLPDITDVNLRKITSRAKKVYILYEGIGIDKIGQVTYSASAISSLKDIQIQNIINDFSKKSTDMNRQAQSTISSEIKVIGVTNCHVHMSSSTDLSNTKVSISPVFANSKNDQNLKLPQVVVNIATKVTASKNSNLESSEDEDNNKESSDDDEEDIDDNDDDDKDNNETNSKDSTKVNTTHDHAYFRNKTLSRYSDLYKLFISEKFDRYGIIEGLLCPVCKLDHDDGKSVKGRYEDGSYFIIYGKREIEITA
ncbi:hypothetical protein Glove_277g15 [Diversispora epigaea]|uniref:Uncharacterized protein n=1 Tax=Diversispora epigaea TaxID=1348612 RepID=A0A397I4I4_9GLOM|nr:hypothetical protein Glove_277g15 [Diversispora epigaea]